MRQGDRTQECYSSALLGIGGGEQEAKPLVDALHPQKYFQRDITNSSFPCPLKKYASFPLFSVIRGNWNLHWGPRIPVLGTTVDFSLKNKAEAHGLTPTGSIIWFSILQKNLPLSFSSSPQWTLIPESMVFSESSTNILNLLFHLCFY